jgi:uncharacterized protein
MTVTRRSFLTGSVGALGGGMFLGGPFAALTARAAGAAPPMGTIPSPYGPMEVVTGGGDLLLPARFTAVRFGEAGTPLVDGTPTPALHDGMAAFNGPGRSIHLVRNHEITNTAGAFGDPAKAYDPVAGGGTTTVAFDPRLGEFKGGWVSGNGTINNCAGGPTPNGSWLTCEENVSGPLSGYTKPHGYVYEVPSRPRQQQQVTTPLLEMGRFVHEATATDPGSGIVYETEDRTINLTNPSSPVGSGFYRFIPRNPNRLERGGRLQMLAIDGKPNYNTSANPNADAEWTVHWVDIDDPDPAAGETNAVAVFQQGWTQGGAIFNRLEGAWFRFGSIFFTSTNGGAAGRGQVFEYRPERGGGRLRLIYESPSVDVLDAPDNITVSPRGGVLLCEDGGGDQYLRGITPQGELFDFCLNIQGEQNEFAGATYSPDGDVLFVNIQNPGATYAITGPWRRGPL